VKVIGEFNPAAPASGVDFGSGSLLGAHVRLEDARGVLLDAALPSASGATCDPGDGWQTIDAFTEEYRNVSGALPPTCAAGSAQGLTRLQLYDTRRDLPLDPPAIGFDVRVDRATLPFEPRADAGGIRFTLAFGNPPGPGLASPEARAGWCSEINERGGGLDCREVLKNGNVQRIICDNL
jgi:hypothetical protein